MVIKTYPKRIFDNIIKLGRYGEKDSFISIISSFRINDPVFQEDPGQIPEGRRYLQVEFDDVLMDADYNTHSVRCIRPEQALALLEFGLGSDDQATLHIHCQAGVSRSVAVAESIAAILNSQNREASVSHTTIGPSPNRVVLREMEAAYAKLLQGPSI